jgi:hypothetical protein
MAIKKSVKSPPSTKNRSYSMTALSEEKVKKIEKEFLEQHKQKKSKPDYPKILKVSFRSKKDCDKFALLIQQTIDFSEKQIDFKIPTFSMRGNNRFQNSCLFLPELARNAPKTVEHQRFPIPPSRHPFRIFQRRQITRFIRAIKVDIVVHQINHIVHFINNQQYDFAVLTA